MDLRTAIAFKPLATSSWLIRLFPGASGVVADLRATGRYVG
jgi:hypothetical protein